MPSAVHARLNVLHRLQLSEGRLGLLNLSLSSWAREGIGGGGTALWCAGDGGDGGGGGGIVPTCLSGDPVIEVDLPSAG